MTQFLPYLLNSFMEWAKDNRYHIHIQFKANPQEVQFFDLRAHITDGVTSLSISYGDHRNLQIKDDSLSFRVNAGTRTKEITVPFEDLTMLVVSDPKTDILVYQISLEGNPTQFNAPVRERELVSKRNPVPYLTLVKD